MTQPLYNDEDMKTILQNQQQILNRQEKIIKKLVSHRIMLDFLCNNRTSDDKKQINNEHSDLLPIDTIEKLEDL